jgi:hypothetical protein
LMGARAHSSCFLLLSLLVCSWPFKVVNEGGKPIIEVEYRNEVKRFKAEEISSMVRAGEAVELER